ncbi:MAG: hypothetical protein KAX78_09430, partial [Phycisphaerae bacterium]|nr:hypothetical protein [Phycisphaerae bacterium]
MRLILFDLDDEGRRDFYPLSLSRPVWELRCGMTTLGEKLIAAADADDVACFVPPYLAETYRQSCPFEVNDPATLRGDALLVLDGRVKADALPLAPGGPSQVALDRDGRPLYATIAPADAARHECCDAAQLLAWARDNLPQVKCDPPLWRYTWDLMLANPDQITADFASAGRSGIEGTFSHDARFVGAEKDIFVGPGATVAAMVVIDATGGPVYIDQGAEIQPFSHITGPC